jgi:hypothetical protein
MAKDNVRLVAAIETKRAAAAQVEKILPKVEGTPRYLSAIEKLAIMYFDIAQLQSEQIALGGKSGSQAKGSQAAYYKKVIQFSNLVLESSKKGSTRILLLRGQSFKELGDWQSAIRDFRMIVSINPKAQDAVTASLVAYDTLLEKQDFQLARDMLEKLGVGSEHPQYFIVTEYLANVHFRMKSYLKGIQLIDKALTSGAPIHASGLKYEVQRKSLFNLISQIYASAIEAKEPGIEIKNVLNFYTSRAKSADLPKLLTEFAVQLRIRNLETPLASFGKVLPELVASKPVILETQVSVEQLTLDYYFKKNISSEIENSVSRLHNAYLALRDIAQENKIDPKLLTRMSETLYQGIHILRAQGENQLPVIAKLYECLLLVPEPNAMTTLGYHLDLAQIYEKIQSHELATGHFRWVALHSRDLDQIDPKKVAFVKEASLRAIVNRYLRYKAEKLVPEDLKVQALLENEGKELRPDFKEWVEWIDSEPKREDSAMIQTMYFEKSRILYHLGHRERALKGIQKLLKQYPKTNYAEAGLSLTIDTYLKSENWEATVQTAQGALMSQLVLRPEFRNSLEQSGSFAYLKWLENKMKKEEFKSVVRGTDQVLKDFPHSKLKNDLLALAGDAALRMNQAPLARSYFAQLDRKTAKKEYLIVAAITEASDAEENGRFADAAKEYRNYLKLKSDDRLKKKVLLLSWITGNPQELKTSLEDHEVCKGRNSEESCELYRALYQLMVVGGKDSASLDESLGQWKRASGDSQTVWAVVALSKKGQLKWADRQQVVKQVLNGVDQVDPLVKLVLLSRILETLPYHLDQAQGELNRIAPLKLSKSSISKRMELIKSWENILQQAEVTHIAYIQTACQLAIGSLYRNLVRELEAIPAPSGLTESDLTAFKSSLHELALPFKSKAIESITVAFQTASRTAMNPEMTGQISSIYFSERPESEKELKENWTAVSHEKLSSSLQALELKAYKDQPELWNVWRQALREGNLQKAAYLVAVAKKQAKLKEEDLVQWAAAVELAQVGAESESLQILAQRLVQAEKGAVVVSCNQLVYRAYLAFSKEQTQDRLNQCESVRSRLNPKLGEAVSKWMSSSRKKEKINEKL